VKAAGAERVFSEKQSGAKTDRAALAALLSVLATVAERGAGFRSLSDPWADNTTPHGRLMLTVRGGLAEFERSPDWRRANSSYGARCQVRPEAEANRASDCGGQGQARSARRPE
jgi:hypothetical protein